MRSEKDKGNGNHGHDLKVSVQAREFGIPPIHDALVLGRASHIGCVAMRKAVDLLVACPFDHLEIEDDVIGDVLVRTHLLKRFPRDRFIRFVLDRIKPLMTKEEVLHLDLHVEVHLEEEQA